MRGGGVRREEWEEWEKSEVGTRVFWFARFSEWWLVCLTQAPLSPGPLSVPHKHLGSVSICRSAIFFNHLSPPPLSFPLYILPTPLVRVVALPVSVTCRYHCAISAEL